ncbi:FAD-dependent oxidoreductase [Pseudonocardia kongjuensis]|uniref:oxidoreductase n=1 Tax=Pseudonocardia kongjuensis TaxID=102227 RepID=UPI0031D60979
MFGPHETNLGDAGRGITDDHVAYYAERAAGGAGIIVVEPASVHPSDHPYAYAPAAFRPAAAPRSGAVPRSGAAPRSAAAPRPAAAPRSAAAPGPAAALVAPDPHAEMQLSGLPRADGPAELHLGDVPAARGWAAVAQACRPHGTLVLAGLAHAGGQGSTAHSGHPLWGPSAVPDVVSREVPVAMDAAQIEEIVLGFAAAARSAVDNGVDGVEISAGQHSLLRQFCSGLTNHRTDAYGRDRSLLLRRVLAAVREEIGPEPLLTLRLCIDELAPWAGITPADGVGRARAVAADVDLLVPVAGSGLSVAATRPDLHTPEAFLRERCAAVRRAVDGATAVALAGSVASPSLAEDVLTCGDADIVEMTRAQIADPSLVALVRAGTPERVRPCLLTNALAAARDPRNPVVGDELEPRSGYERTEPAVVPRSAAGPPVPRPVLVVGGGPAGCEAARTLALLGHPVTLHERSSRLGGMLHAAAALPGRSRLLLAVPWWERELARLGVRVELGSDLDGSAVAAASARGVPVLLATGSRPTAPGFGSDVPVVPAAELAAAAGSAGTDLAGSRRVRTLLAAGGVSAGAPVLVRDPVGDWTGPGVAELLAGAGYRVTLSTPDAVAGHQLGRCGDMAPANARLERAGVVRALFTAVRHVRDGVAELVDVHTGAVTTVPCAAVVDCAARLPDRTLPDAPGRRSIGDRVAPRTIAEAVREGRRAAQALGEGLCRAPEPAGSRRVAAPAAEGHHVARATVERATAGPGAGGRAAGAGRAEPAVSPRLGDPLRLGRHPLRNRIVFTAHLTGFAEGGLPTPRHVGYYAARAAGGAGLVITEEHAVHPADRPYERLIRGHDPAVLPGYRALTDAVHRHGAVVLAQLNHNGAQGSGMYSREPVVGPSALPDPMFREVPAELDAAGIAEIVAAFADVAARCVDGGFDGVELQCSHASLLRLFLSPATNRRTDAWGRDRAKIVLDVVAAVREAIGPDPVLGLRIGVDERIPGGITPDDGAALARRLVATGAVDHLNTSIGVATSTLHLIEPSMHTPSGYAGRLAARLRDAVREAGADVPVIGVGRFTTPAQAAGALDRGECDLVGIARGQIADPAFAAKALAGRPVRRCVGCNQDCIGRVGLNLPLGCLVDPAAGREWLAPAVLPVGARPPAPARSGPARPTGSARSGLEGPPAPERSGPAGPVLRVLVAGAGPAGLSAAAALAGRGHDVLLVERATRTGGRLALAATAPGRAELGHVTDDLLRAVHESGARLRLGTEVDRAFVEEYRPDALVLATGARPAPPPWDPDGLTVPVDDVLAGAPVPDGPVLVVDELGFHHATSVAELLSARGHDTEIVTPALVVGQDLGLTLDREGFRCRAHAAGIRCSTDRAVLGVQRTGEQSRAVELLHHPTGRIERREVAAVVAAVPAVPSAGTCARLWTGPGEDGPTVHRIGDALTPRRADAAIREGSALLSAVLT